MHQWHGHLIRTGLVGRSIHRPGAELLAAVRQLGPATPVSLGELDLEGQTAGTGVGFAVVVTPLDLQDLESSKKTGSVGGSMSGWTGNGVSSRSTARQRLRLLVVRARLHDRTP